MGLWLLPSFAQWPLQCSGDDGTHNHCTPLPMGLQGWGAEDKAPTILCPSYQVLFCQAMGEPELFHRLAKKEFRSLSPSR